MDKQVNFLYWRIPSKRIIKRFGIEGKGPGELLSADNIDTSRPNEIWVFDVTLRKFVCFEVDKVLRNSNYRPEKYIQLQGDSVIPHICNWINEGLITMNLGMGARMLYYDHNGKFQKMNGKFPPKRSRDEPNSINAQAYAGVSTISEKNKRVAIGAVYSDRLDVFDLEGNEIVSIRGSEKYEPQYQIYDVSGNAVFGPDTEKMKMGFIDISSTDQYIYVLFSGKNFLANPADANTIFVYDWSGKQVVKYHLDKSVFSIVVDTENEKIYASTIAGDPDVLVFDIPKI